MTGEDGGRGSEQPSHREGLALAVAANHGTAVGDLAEHPAAATDRFTDAGGHRSLPQLKNGGTAATGPGGSSSAIFQLGQGSVSSGIGEAIGSSGWVLSEVTDSGAVISRNGQRQTLSVGGLF